MSVTKVPMRGVNTAVDTAAGDDANIGYTAAEGLILTGQGSTNDITIKRDDDTAVLEVATGQSDIEVTGGNIFFGTADKGIYLGVTSATAANLLDDYEEGTFTATARLGGPTGDDNGTATMTYTKTGRAVHVEGAVTWDSSQSGSGLVSISGLPFTLAGSARVSLLTGDRTTNTGQFGGNASGTAINFYAFATGTSGTLANLTESVMGSGGGKSWYISMTYFV